MYGTFGISIGKPLDISRQPSQEKLERQNIPGKSLFLPFQNLVIPINL